MVVNMMVLTTVTTPVMLLVVMVRKCQPGSCDMAAAIAAVVETAVPKLRTRIPVAQIACVVFRSSRELV